MSLSRLILALNAAGLHPTGAELADALWLAGLRDPADAEAGPAAGAVPPDVPPSAPRPAATPSPPAPRPPADLRVRDEATARALPLPSVPVRTSGTTALPTAARLSRGLRPLKLRMPSRYDTELDEEATARRFAETGRWHPVRRPVQTRWLDVALIVDADPSMVIWRQLTEELTAAIARLGAFRDVRRWFLHHDESGIGLSPEAGGTARRDPAELIDPTGRRITLIVSSAIGPAWDTGAICPVLNRYGRAGPTAIISPLPQRLWDRTTLRARLGTAEAARPGAANTLLRYIPRGEDDDLAAGEVPVPVLELNPLWLNGWARLVAGTGAADVAIGTLATAPASPVPEQPLDHVVQFRRHASVEAFQLLRHLAVVPLSIPVMRLVQRATSADPDPAHLAEVYLSGLLRPVSAEDTGVVAFDFVAGVREVLLGLLRRTEATRVLTAVSHLLDTHPNGGRGFTAYLPTDAYGRPVRLSAEPFAAVAAQVLRHLRTSPDALDRAALAVANRPASDDPWQNTITRTSDRLYRYLRSRALENPEDAEDAVQEVYARAMERGEPPENDAHLFVIADDIAKQRLAQLARSETADLGNEELDTITAREDLVFSLLGYSDVTRPTEPDQLVFQLGKNELWTTVREASAGLPAEQRRVMEAIFDRVEEQCSLGTLELAEQIDMSPEKFTILRRRARRAIPMAVVTLIAARSGQERCPNLAVICQTRLSPEQLRAGRRLILDADQTRRIQKHVESCAECSRFKRVVGNYGDW